jgi:undecaprenyl phosphate N,N'-diacetylbacillosamine 1-phosphate transferase
MNAPKMLAAKSLKRSTPAAFAASSSSLSLEDQQFVIDRVREAHLLTQSRAMNTLRQVLGVRRAAPLFNALQANYRRFFKRALDFTCALLGLILLGPALLGTALLIRVFLGSPVLFKQQRPGLHENPFYVLKFRSMTDARDSAGNLLPDRERLPPFGVWLRKSSLNELPGLINILRGDMSLIGPRPLLMTYLPYYTERERLRHTVRPDITGLAQISERNTVGWDQRLAYDVEFVRNTFLPARSEDPSQNGLPRVTRSGGGD